MRDLKKEREESIKSVLKEQQEELDRRANELISKIHSIIDSDFYLDKLIEKYVKGKERSVTTIESNSSWFSDIKELYESACFKTHFDIFNYFKEYMISYLKSKGIEATRVEIVCVYHGKKWNWKNFCSENIYSYEMRIYFNEED